MQTKKIIRIRKLIDDEVYADLIWCKTTQQLKGFDSMIRLYSIYLVAEFSGLI